MLSRVLGLVRDVVLANVFGAGGGADAFFIAFKIPNFLRRLFAEGAFAQAFVPVLAEYREEGGIEAMRALISRISAWLGAWLILVTLFAVVFAPYVALIFAPGFWFAGETEKLSLTGELLRIVFPYLLLISYTAFVSSILNSVGRFAIPALTPIWLNICLISSALWLTSFFEAKEMALAIGVISAGAFQLIFQLPSLTSAGLLVRPVWQPNHPGVKKVARLMIPALFGVSVSQVNLLLDTVLASLLEDGSVGWLYYADRLSELPLGLIGIALATVVLPSLSADHARKDSERFSGTLNWALKLTFLLGVPATFALVVLAEPLILTLFYHGELNLVDVGQISLALKAYATGLMAFMLIKVLAPGFFAQQNIKKPVQIAIVAMVANMVFNLILVWPLKHVGLALATSLSSWLNAGLLLFFLIKGAHMIIERKTVVFLVQSLGAAMIMSLVLYQFQPSMQEMAGLATFDRVLFLAGLVIGGLVTFGLSALLLGVRPSSIKH